MIDLFSVLLTWCNCVIRHGSVEQRNLLKRRLRLDGVVIFRSLILFYFGIGVASGFMVFSTSEFQLLAKIYEFVMVKRIMLVFGF